MSKLAFCNGVKVDGEVITDINKVIRIVEGKVVHLEKIDLRKLQDNLMRMEERVKYEPAQFINCHQT